MSKTNRFTLVATLLLGILLYTVLRFTTSLQDPPVNDTAPPVAVEPVLDNVQPTILSAAPVDSGMARITSHAELVAFLDTQGINGRLTVDEAARWHANQGFPGTNELLGITIDNAPGTYYDTLDELTLETMSAAGDAGATQALARIKMFVDPFAALGLYGKAVGQGSVYAVIKVADTMSLFGETQLADYLSDAETFQKLLELQKSVPSRHLHTEAYATMLSALSAGGPPIIDDELLAMTARYEEKVPQRALEYACKRSADILIANSGARRSNGIDPLATQPPPIFLSPADLEERMPCATTDFPLVSAMNLQQCRVVRVSIASGEEANLYICQR